MKNLIEAKSEFINTNIVGTVNLLDCCLDYWESNKINDFNTWRVWHFVININKILTIVKKIGGENE